MKAQENDSEVGNQAIDMVIMMASGVVFGVTNSTQNHHHITLYIGDHGVVVILIIAVIVFGIIGCVGGCCGGGGERKGSLSLGNLSISTL